MENLNKQQIILLTLLVSFVTSIATGIVTVALMDQAPVGVVNTINHVIERTVEEAAAPNTTVSDQANSISSSDQNQVSSAIAIAEKSLVQIKNAGGSVTGIGLVVSKTGIVVSDKSSIAAVGDYSGVLPDGQEFPLQVIQSQINGDFVFLLLNIPADKKSNVTLTPAILVAPTLSLGQTIISLSSSGSLTADQGIIKRINTDASSSIDAYLTDIHGSDLLLGSPLLDTTGAVFGIKTFSLQTDQSGVALPDNETSFYPMTIIKSSLPVLITAVSKVIGTSLAN